MEKIQTLEQHDAKLESTKEWEITGLQPGVDRVRFIGLRHAAQWFDAYKKKFPQENKAWNGKLVINIRTHEAFALSEIPLEAHLAAKQWVHNVDCSILVPGSQMSDTNPMFIEAENIKDYRN